ADRRDRNILRENARRPPETRGAGDSPRTRPLTRLTLPDMQPVLTLDDRPAFLLRVGPKRWPVLITQSDFEKVTRSTGHEHWGIQGRNVVVGGPDPLVGR